MIDVSKLVTGAFATIKNTVQGAVRQCTYRSAGATETYNPVTGVMASNTVDYPIEAVFVGYTRKEKENDFQNSRRQTIEFGDMKVLVPYSSLPIPLTLEDHIIDGTKTWRVINFSTDPTGAALHTFQVRQS